VPKQSALGLFIRDQRQQKDWSQERLASRASTSRQTIATLEKSGHGTIETLQRVLTALGVRHAPLGNSDLAVDQSDGSDLVEIENALETAATTVQRARDLIIEYRLRAARDPIEAAAIEEGKDALRAAASRQRQDTSTSRRVYPGELRVEQPTVGYASSRPRRKKNQGGQK
jgi:transcriptional regulator with XRE-family HTH domain